MSIMEMQVNALMRLCLAEQEPERQRAKQELKALLRQHGPEVLDPEDAIRQILLELGAPDHLIGHPYVVRGILLVVSNQMFLNNITFGLYPQLAAEFDTTAARVERSIRHLIEITWERGDMDVLNRYFGNTVSPDRGKPTNGEFIARIANVVKSRMKASA